MNKNFPKIIYTTYLITALFIFLPSFANASTIQTNSTNLNNDSLKNGLIGYWTLDGIDTTDKIYDRSGNGNNGSFLGGATSSAKTLGKTGQAIKFDGVDDQINLGSGVPHEGASQITISLWAKFKNNHQVSIECLLGQNAPGPSNTMSAGGANAEIADTYWHHYVGVYDGTSLKLYIDNVIRGGTSTLAGTVNSVSSGLAIGSLGDDGYAAAPATIDDIRIYNRALSASEIMQLYNNGK